MLRNDLPRSEYGEAATSEAMRGPRPNATLPDREHKKNVGRNEA